MKRKWKLDSETPTRKIRGPVKNLNRERNDQIKKTDVSHKSDIIMFTCKQYISVCFHLFCFVFLFLCLNFAWRFARVIIHFLLDICYFLKFYMTCVCFVWMKVIFNEFLYVFDRFLGFLYHVLKYFNFFVYFFMYFVLDFRNFLGFLSNCMETSMIPGKFCWI